MTIDDVRWVSSALLLDQTDDEAVESFMALISESLDCKTTRLMHAIRECLRELPEYPKLGCCASCHLPLR